MATVRRIIEDALIEVGVLQAGDNATAADLAFCLGRFQRQIDAWAADRLTLSVQSRTSITWTAGNSVQTIGPTGADTTAQRPVWINQLNYVVPASNPAVEVPIGPMDADSYAQQSIKTMTSQYPLSYFYQTSIDTVLGSITLWPVPTGGLTLYLYAPQAVDVPVSVSDDLIGPPGYQEAFMYELAMRLCTPYGRTPPEMLPKLATDAYARMKRPNLDPGLLGTDAALVPNSGGAYNILSDTNGWSS